jgi:PAS domain-containing protein
MKRVLPPLPLTALSIFILSFVFQSAVAAYLIQISVHHATEESSLLKMQIAKDLGSQLTQALGSHDDLAALAVVKACRINHPQLQEARVFDSSGKILLHTDPGMMGKKISVAPGPKPTKPEVRLIHHHERVYTDILVPLEDENGLFFQVQFDETRNRQSRQAVAIRFFLLTLLSSLFLGTICWLGLRRYDWTNPLERAESQPVSAENGKKIRHLAGLLLSEMAHAAIAVDRNNQILAANTLALELLNCRQEELEGLHILQSPLSPRLMEFYQKAIKTPTQPVEDKVVISTQGLTLPVRITCAPPSLEWEVALISLA